MDAQVDGYLERYARWVEKYEKKFDFYVTFDYVVEAPIVWQVTRKLQKLGARPVPVYHGDQSISWFQKYIDEGHRLIGLSKRFFLNDLRSGLTRYYDQIFNLAEKQGVACHGFAATGSEAWRYPWYSIDSTSLVKEAGMGTIRFIDHRGLYRKVPISNNTISNGKVEEELFQLIQKRKFTLEQLREERTSRVLFNAISLQEFLQHRSRKLWTRKTLF